MLHQGCIYLIYFIYHLFIYQNIITVLKKNSFKIEFIPVMQRRIFRIIRIFSVTWSCWFVLLLNIFMETLIQFLGFFDE